LTAFLGYTLVWGSMSFWGELYCPTYFLSLPFITPKTRANKRIGPHSLQFYSMILGSLLGDSYAEKHGNGTRIILQQENYNVEYLMWFWKELSDMGYISLEIPKLKIRTHKGGKVQRYYKIRTWSFSSFNWIYEVFYPDGVKVVPKCIGDYLTPLALAVWVMDDGTAMKYGLKISTNSFMLSDVQFLCNILQDKYNIKATPNRDGDQWVLYIHAHSVCTLRNLVKPYLISSMINKLGLSSSSAAPPWAISFPKAMK
jgi:ubiquinol-cytochrome c reductase cytochrome b subunit